MQLNLDFLPRFLRQWILNLALKNNKRTVDDLAPKIRNNKQLRKVIMATKPAYRRGVYDYLKPKLSFKPKPFFLLIK